MHDDIEFRTKGWGDIVIDILKDETISGCVTIGSSYVRKAPSYTNNERFSHFNILDEYGHNKSTTETLQPIITFDGYWFCVKKVCFQYVSFDQNHYKGFHYYDMDMGMQLYQWGYKMVYTPDILIFHKSGANFNTTWLENSFIFHQKWKKSLPLYHPEVSAPPSKKETKKFELEAIYTTLRQIIKFRKPNLLGKYLRMVKSSLGIPIFFHILASIIHHIKKNHV